MWNTTTYHVVPEQSILKLKILAKFEAATQLQIYFEELNSIQIKTTLWFLSPSQTAGILRSIRRLQCSVVIFSIIFGKQLRLLSGIHCMLLTHFEKT